MGGSVSFKNINHRTKESLQTKHKNDATSKINEKELDITTDRPFSEYLIKGQTA